MKKYILTALIFALILLVACADSGSAPFNPGGIFCTEDLAEGEVLTVYRQGDRLLVSSIDEMLRFLNLSKTLRIEIVRVEVLGARTDWYNTNLAWQHEGALPFLEHYDNHGWDHLSDNYEPYTFYSVRVLEVFQGDSEVGDILEVLQEGGQIGNVRLEAFSLPLTPGDDLVLFLSSASWMPNSPAGIASSKQAAFRFPALGDGDSAFRIDERLEPVHQFPEHMAERALSLTLGDLANFQIENFGQVSDSFRELLSESE